MARLRLLWLANALVLGLAALPAGGVRLGLHEEPEPVEKKLPCHRTVQRKSTLKAIKESPLSGLFRELRNSTVFEASAVARIRRKFYVVFDNARSIGYLDSRFQFRDPENRLIGPWEPESQFEGIAYQPESDTFLLLIEAAPDEEAGGAFKPLVHHIKIADDLGDYELLYSCKVDFVMTHENKGFESIQYLHTDHGAYLLGMCEGNFCVGGQRGKQPGNGRIVISQWKDLGDGKCVWQPVKVVQVPPTADFKDYSGMSYNYQTHKLAILSQEESRIWIGDFDPDRLEFLTHEGVVFYLPRDNHCNIIYCNAEGINWIDDFRIVVASDKAKTYQPFWCDQKDQSIHLFAMPRAWDPYSPSAATLAALEAEAAADAFLEAREL